MHTQEDFDLATVDVNLGGTTYTAMRSLVAQYKVLMDQLQSALASHLSVPGSEITVVGHSLGGARAQLAAVELANKYQASVRLITFAALVVFEKQSAQEVYDTLVQPDPAEGQFGVPFPAAGMISAQRWVRMGDFAPGYGEDLTSGNLMHMSRGFVMHLPRVSDTWEYTQKRLDYTPWNDAVSILTYHLLKQHMWAILSGGCAPEVA